MRGEVTRAQDRAVREADARLPLDADHQRPSQGGDRVEDGPAPVRAVGNDGHVGAQCRREGVVDIVQDAGHGATPLALGHAGVLWPRAHGDGEDEPLPDDARDEGMRTGVDGGLVKDEDDATPAPVGAVVVIAVAPAVARVAGVRECAGESARPCMGLVGLDDGGEEQGDRAGGDLPQEGHGVQARIGEGARHPAVDAGDQRAPGVGSAQEQGVRGPGDLVRDPRVGTHEAGEDEGGALDEGE